MAHLSIIGSWLASLCSFLIFFFIIDESQTRMRGDLPSCSRILSTRPPSLWHTRALTTKFWMPNSTRCPQKCNAMWDTCLDKSRNERRRQATREDPRMRPLWHAAQAQVWRTRGLSTFIQNPLPANLITLKIQFQTTQSHPLHKSPPFYLVMGSRNSNLCPMPSHRRWPTITALTISRGSHQTPVCLFPSHLQTHTLTVLSSLNP